MGNNIANFKIFSCNIVPTNSLMPNGYDMFHIESYMP